MKAKIKYRNGGFHLTETEDDPKTIAQKMTGGGFIICNDERWGKKRTLVINLGDVVYVELTEA